DHVLYAVVTVCRVVQRTLLVDDADSRLVGGDLDFIYLVYSVLHNRVELHCTLHSSLRVELRREGYLKEHVFHHVRTVWPLELEFIALEEDVVETPCFCG